MLQLSFMLLLMSMMQLMDFMNVNSSLVHTLVAITIPTIRHLL